MACLWISKETKEGYSLCIAFVGNCEIWRKWGYSCLQGMLIYLKRRGQTWEKWMIQAKV
jgi:hypothetical protein